MALPTRSVCRGLGFTAPTARLQRWLSPQFEAFGGPPRKLDVLASVSSMSFCPLLSGISTYITQSEQRAHVVLGGD